MIVSPILRKKSSKTDTAFCDVWLPESGYTDIFTNTVYSAGSFKMSRGSSSIPVLAKPGAIIPLDRREKYSDAPSDELEILIFSGNGSFKMYDDDGITTGYKNGMFAKTDFTLETKDDCVDFSISVSDDLSFVPERKYILSFRNIAESNNVEVFGSEWEKSTEHGFLQIVLSSVSPEKKVNVCIKNFIPFKNKDRKEMYIQALSSYGGFNAFKSFLLNSLCSGKENVLIPRRLKIAVDEIKYIKI